jgi:hypothetical protein
MEVSTSQLVGEGVAVAVIITVMFIIIHVAMMQYNEPMAMGHAGIFGGVALAAFLAHLALEVTGGNAKFIEMRTKP